MKLGRNDMCYCGSGKKFKKCCMAKLNNSELLFKENFDKIHINIDKKEQVKSVFYDTYKYMMNENWQGACHALSSIQYILLSELGFEPKLCIGVVGVNGKEFDHSWIELDGQIYDTAIANGLEGIKISEPIISGVNIVTLNKSELRYGTGRKLDFPASLIKNMSVTEYLDGYPVDDSLKDGLYGLIVVIGKNIGLNLDTNTLRKKYSEVNRTIL